MNLFDALNAHLAWKQRLHDYVEGDTSEYLDTDEVGLDDRCELGCWIRDSNGTINELPEFIQLRELHADFHRCLAQVAGLANRGSIPAARAALQADFARVSAMLVKAITRLNRAAGDNSSAAA